MQAAARYRRPVYTRGAGTNLSGGSTPVDGGLVVCMLDMHEIVEIDAVNLTATVQPGVIIKDLDEACGKLGLMYPPDPGSVAVATMGGSVAECSGGLRGLKYGVTKDYVMGLEVVLADGRVLRSGGKTVKNVTGYDLVKLMVGSEGTLGVITEITVKLRPRPEAVRSMLVYFDDQKVAADAAVAIVGAGVIPATLEFMDHTTIVAVENFTHVGLREDAEAALLIEVDGIPEVVEREAATVLEVLRAHGGEVKEAAMGAERDSLWAARRAALPAVARLRPTIIVEDATVPRSQITAMLDLVAELAEKHDLAISVVGHAGDGNLHPSILCDKNDPVEMARVNAAIDELFAGDAAARRHAERRARHRHLQAAVPAVGDRRRGRRGLGAHQARARPARPAQPGQGRHAGGTGAERRTPDGRARLRPRGAARSTSPPACAAATARRSARCTRRRTARAAVARGKVAIAAALLNGEIEPDDEALRQLDLCLTCTACVAGCPSGVRIDDVILAARAEVVRRQGSRRRSPPCSPRSSGRACCKRGRGRRGAAAGPRVRAGAGSRASACPACPIPRLGRAVLPRLPERPLDGERRLGRRARQRRPARRLLRRLHDHLRVSRDRPRAGRRTRRRRTSRSPAARATTAAACPC